MRMTNAFLLTVWVMTAPTALADVVMTMSSRDAAGNDLSDNEIFIRGEHIRVDIVDGADGNSSVIFRGDEMIAINHDAREYVRLDEATMESLGQQFNQAMQMMQQQLASLPPEQRAMAEKMMQSQMQGMGIPGAAAGPPRIEAGGAGSHGGYSCTNYTVYEGDAKTQEICAAGLTQIEGLSEMRAAFERMAVFLQKMSDAFGPGPLADIGRTPMAMMEQIDGFPVFTRRFDGKEVAEEVVLTSVSTESLDAALFAPPAGYSEREVVPSQ